MNPTHNHEIPLATHSFTGSAYHGMKDSGSQLPASAANRTASRTASRSASRNTSAIKPEGNTEFDNDEQLPDDDDEYGGTEDDEADAEIDEKAYVDLQSKKFIRPASHKTSSVKYEDFEEADFLR